MVLQLFGVLKDNAVVITIEMKYITMAKSFVILAPGANVIKLFTAISYDFS
jgi:hypothetical protein